MFDQFPDAVEIQISIFPKGADRQSNRIRPEGLEASPPCLEVSAEQPILLVLRGSGRSHSGLIRLIRQKLSSKLCNREPVRSFGSRVFI